MHGSTPSTSTGNRLEVSYRQFEIIMGQQVIYGHRQIRWHYFSFPAYCKFSFSYLSWYYTLMIYLMHGRLTEYLMAIKLSIARCETSETVQWRFIYEKWKDDRLNKFNGHTEMTRAEVARANPAILVASTHFLANSLRSDCREQLTLAPADSTPKALDTLWDDLNCRPFLAGTASFEGCISVAAACSEAAMFSFTPYSLDLWRVCPANVMEWSWKQSPFVCRVEDYFGGQGGSKING